MQVSSKASQRAYDGWFSGKEVPVQSLRGQQQVLKIPSRWTSQPLIINSLILSQKATVHIGIISNQEISILAKPLNCQSKGGALKSSQSLRDPVFSAEQWDLFGRAFLQQCLVQLESYFIFRLRAGHTFQKSWKYKVQADFFLFYSLCFGVALYTVNSSNDWFEKLDYFVGYLKLNIQGPFPSKT